jgi:hypothetical protein
VLLNLVFFFCFVLRGGCGGWVQFSEFLEELSKCTGSCILISVLGVCVGLSLCFFFPRFALCGRNSSGFGSFPFSEVCEKTDGSRDWLICLWCAFALQWICVFLSLRQRFFAALCMYLCVCVCFFGIVLIFMCKALWRCRMTYQRKERRAAWLSFGSLLL